MNACIKPGDWAQLPKQIADLAGKTLRETGKAALHKVKSEGQAIAQSVTSGLGDMVGNITDMGGEITAGLKSAGAIEDSPLVDGTSDVGAENTALQGGSSETSSSLTGFNSLQGGHQETLQVAGGTTQTTGGLQSEYQTSLHGPSSGAQQIPDVTSSDRPAMRMQVTERWDNVENTVYDNNEDRLTIESSQANTFNPPSNRLGSPPSDYNSMATMSPLLLGDVFSEPTVGQCAFPGGLDCNDGLNTDWENVRFGSDPDTGLDVSGLLNGGSIGDNPGTGVCDESATRACAGRHCSWRQCRSNCQVRACGAPRCDPPTVTTCTTSGDPPVTTCTTTVRCCTVCCNAAEVLSSCGARPNCSAFHAGCCLQDTPGGLVQLELGGIGVDIPGGGCRQQNRNCEPNLCPLPGPCSSPGACS